MFTCKSGLFQENTDTLENTPGNVLDNQIQGTTIGGDGTEMQRMHIPYLFLFEKVAS